LVRATPTGNRDELSVLVDDFNGMLSQIQERDTAFAAATMSGQRVEERTKELPRPIRNLKPFLILSPRLASTPPEYDGFSQALLEENSDKTRFRRGGTTSRRVRRAHSACRVD